MGVLERINQLAKKAKAEGLTSEEVAERDRLRQEYLKIFRGNFQNVMDSVYVEDENGNAVKLERKTK